MYNHNSKPNPNCNLSPKPNTYPGKNYKSMYTMTEVYLDMQRMPLLSESLRKQVVALLKLNDNFNDYTDYTVLCVPCGNI